MDSPKMYRFRQPVTEIARWISFLASLLVFIILVSLVFIADYRLQDQRTIAVLAIAGASLLVGVLFFISAASLNIRGDKVVLRLFPLIYISFNLDEVTDARVVEISRDLEQWGLHGRPRSQHGRVISVGGVNRMVAIQLEDGRKYGITLNSERFDLSEIARVLRQEVDVVPVMAEAA